MTVTFGDFRFSVTAFHDRARSDETGISTETEGAAFVYVITLPGHKIDYLVSALLIEFPGIRIRDSGHVAGKFNDGDLHSQADS